MSTSAETVTTARRLPGDLAMWFFILAELTVFALLLLAFAVAQALHPHVFSEGRHLLDRSTGLAMTLSLLTAGLFAALAQEQVRQDRPRRGALFLCVALLLASGYVAIKLTEYAHLLANGLGLEHDTFFTLYWILTGFHFLHVLLGMVILGWLAEGCRRRRYDSQRGSGLESGVLYWHMVDLVWVLLFPLVYILE
ncbi:cytochrome c oxidase subunit 3 family protein [Pseudomonas sp. B21-054]|uniref:cytochrome c oxidase subunit 3 family protein n=1 Tax=Pseudomonas sp. B21-054 TaxID=2895494 RepID=UPI00222E2DC4|nr:cytochrome c oxidase subunit 3 family protein [Pseudomonas sp. B21-054]UZE20479.1 cytochrome c oxidase subunit 3 family protein [Pseudomonas sp. B21-054]